MIKTLIQKTVGEGIDLKVGRREFEISSGDPGRNTHFIFEILEKTSNILG